MSNSGYSVPSVSWAEIDDMTENIRRKYSLLSDAYFPIMDILELVMSNRQNLFQIEIVERTKMPGEYSTTQQDGRLLTIREDIYEKVCRGDGHARFTLAHELGHLIMHCTGIEVYALASGEYVPPYQHSEAQANYFAASLLMPRKFFSFNDTPHSVQHRHGVSLSAARNRLSYFRSKGFLKLPT